ncbi:uncharacterized protein A1O9_10637 [Exophiala aquamarina CBS 119918]|uniref:Uncharacterized protein n=1 Tax=Exophiala aquamarina CBS 119918 TaxID=1182545 RepID=A0A072NZ79_9EURO|nr:uncharacterized protein A1O9_10637 [Exophiala aquamarina CBS 119918]KEF53189.1 hypothetical protein A1O9_10637 [Exophiala aquamarina CBS 119918]
MAGQIHGAGTEPPTEHMPALSDSLSGMGHKPGKCTSVLDGILDVTSEPQITWPLPKAQVLTFDRTATGADEIEPFPDLPNPAINLILARTTLLIQLDANKYNGAYAKFRPRHPFDSIHSRVSSHTGHIKEHENLNRSKVNLVKAFNVINQVRQNRAVGNRGQPLSQGRLATKVGAKSDQPRDELRKALKKRVEQGIKDAFAYEREHGWDIVVEPQPLGEFRDFHDPYWHRRITSPLHPGTELTRNVITALLMLKKTFPLRYLTIDVNPSAVSLGLNGHPRTKSTININEFNTNAKRFKPSRVLGLPCDSSDRECCRPRRSSSNKPRSSSSISTTASSFASLDPDKKALKAKTATLMRRVATKLTVRWASKKHTAASRQQSTSGRVVKDESDPDCEDDDDEYGAAAEVLKQEAHSKEKVSAWLTLTFDGKPFNEIDDASVAELGPIGPLDTSLPAIPVRSTEEAVLASAPYSSQRVFASGSSLQPHQETRTTSVAGKADHGKALPVFSPISTFSPFGASAGHAPSEDSSDENASANGDVAVMETVTLRKPIIPARMVSIRTKSKRAQKALTSPIVPTRSPRKVFHRASKTGDLRDMGDAETDAEFEASPAAAGSARAFHGAFVGRSGSCLRLPSAGDGGGGGGGAAAAAAAADATGSFKGTVNANLSLSFSQRQREFLHRKHHQDQAPRQSLGAKLSGGGPGRGGLFRK